MSRRFDRNRWRRFVPILIFLALVCTRWLTDTEPVDSPLPRRYNESGLDPGTYEVLRVVDGDTLLLKEGRTRVRLQGIDTPETVKEGVAVQKWGPEASAFTKQFLSEADQRVELKVEGEPVDRYGRKLVFLWHDGKLLNEELVRAGLARAKLNFDYSRKMKERLRQAQEDARAAERGIWSR